MPRKVLLLALLICGCGTSVTYTPLRAYPRGTRHSPEAVDVYMSGPPTEPHVDVGILEAEQESELSLDDTKEMLAELRKAAARAGCDALYVKGIGSNAQAALLITDHPSSVKTITGTCIRHTD
jgi:hypothetical protein